jgi:hypothetical protein
VIFASDNDLWFEVAREHDSHVGLLARRAPLADIAGRGPMHMVSGYAPSCPDERLRWPRAGNVEGTPWLFLREHLVEESTHLPP